MNIDQIKTPSDIENYIEGCLNDFETGISDKSETMANLCEPPPCDVCGSADVIEVPHMGKNCNRCHPLNEQ